MIKFIVHLLLKALALPTCRYPPGSGFFMWKVGFVPWRRLVKALPRFSLYSFCNKSHNAVVTFVSDHLCTSRSSSVTHQHTVQDTHLTLVMTS